MEDTVKHSGSSLDTRNQAYLDMIANETGLNEQYKLILKFIINAGGSAIFDEISAGTGIPKNVVTARVRELVKDYEILYCIKDTKKENPISGKMNTLWFINYNKFNEHSLVFSKKPKRKVA